MGQLRHNGYKKNKNENFYIENEDYIKRSNEDRSRRERNKNKRKSHSQYSKEFIEETMWMQHNNPFDYRRTK